MTAPSVRTSTASPRALLAATVAAMLLGACSAGGALDAPESRLSGETSPYVTGALTPSNALAQRPKTELDKAIEHWGKEHAKKPADVTTSLAYARNLRAAGHKEQAMSVLQSAALLHGDNKDVASEMGRLALDLDQVAVAGKLLAIADDPLKPDWRVISARGTVLAKQGKYADAVPLFERANGLAPGQPSVMNNLAMALVANGDPVKAEEILRKAMTTSQDPKIKQNLALVLGLQGKHDEAKSVIANVSDADYIRRMVKPTAGAAVAADVAQPGPAAAPAAVASAQRSAKSGRATATAKSAAPQLRPAGKPTDVAPPAGSWSTTVSAAR